MIIYRIIYVSLYIYIGLCIHIYLYVFVYLYECMHISMYVYICIYIYIYIYIYTFIFALIYIDVYMIHIHIHIVMDSEIVNLKILIRQEYIVTLRDDYPFNYPCFKNVPPLCLECVKDACKITLDGHVRNNFTNRRACHTAS